MIFLIYFKYFKIITRIIIIDILETYKYKLIILIILEQIKLF